MQTIQNDNCFLKVNRITQDVTEWIPDPDWHSNCRCGNFLRYRDGEILGARESTEIQHGVKTGPVEVPVHECLTCGSKVISGKKKNVVTHVIHQSVTGWIKVDHEVFIGEEISLQPELDMNARVTKFDPDTMKAAVSGVS